MSYLLSIRVLIFNKNKYLLKAKLGQRISKTSNKSSPPQKRIYSASLNKWKKQKNMQKSNKTEIRCLKTSHDINYF